MSAHTVNSESKKAQPSIEHGSIILQRIFLGIALFIAIALFTQSRTRQKKEVGSSITPTELKTKPSITEELPPGKIGDIFTLYLKSTDSVMVKNYNGYRLMASTGGTKEKPIPYFRKDGEDWVKYGDGSENLNAPPCFEVWFKGFNSTTSTRIWYWYEKI